MANEAATTIVLRMRDEASPQMQNFGQTTEQATLQSLQLNTALTAMGSAFSAVGSLVGQLDNPLAKTAQTFLQTSGAVLSTVAAIGTMLPYIRNLITSLRSLAIVQSIVQALSGPAGWVTLGVGLAAAGAASAAIVAATGGFGGGTTQVVNINSQAFAGNDAEARQFASKVQRFSREGQRIGR